MSCQGELRNDGKEFGCVKIDRCGKVISGAPAPSPPGPLSHTHSHPPGRGGKRRASGIGLGVPFPHSLDRLRPALSPEEEREWIRRLRVEQTDAEAALWQLVRNRKLIGCKFRRQVPIGRYVADFYSHERKLIVELDGGVHSDPEQQAHDQNRDTFLLSLGLRILRFSNEEALGAPQKVLDQIRKALLSR